MFLFVRDSHKLDLRPREPFQEKFIKELAETLKSSHHFTLSYFPWLNGSVEVVCREVLRGFLALFSETKFPIMAWSTTISTVLSVLNNTKLKRLGDKYPVTMFTGLPPTDLMKTIAGWIDGVKQAKTMDSIRAARLLNAFRTHEAMEGIHKKAENISTSKRKLSVGQHNQRTAVHPAVVYAGDFVIKWPLGRELSEESNAPNCHYSGADLSGWSHSSRITYF